MTWAEIWTEATPFGVTKPAIGLAIWGALTWLSAKFIEHRQSKRLEKFKAQVAGDVKVEVDRLLADEAARRSYEWDARKRLYGAISPLHFQLLLACRDFFIRLEGHGNRPLEISLKSYYGQSLLYRLIRPFVLCELVQRQMAFADFSVDPIGASILKFNVAAKSILSGRTVLGNHPGANWFEQQEHVFFDTISLVVDVLIVREGSVDRCVRYSEFVELLKKPEVRRAIHPFPRIFENMTVENRPVFWLRMVAYACLCAHFLNSTGKEHPLRTTVKPLNVEELLQMTEDKWIIENLTDCVARCRAVVDFSF